MLNGSDCPAGRRYPIPGSPVEAYIRGDFGWPETDYYIERNQQKKQRDISIAPYFLKTGTGPFFSIEGSEISQPTHLPMDASNPPPPLVSPHPKALTRGQIYYPWLAKDLPSYLLSSWSPTREENRYDRYVFPKDSEGDFLKCGHPALRDRPVPSSCAVGGRSGYSVKLVSCESMKEIYDNTDTDKPGNLDEYCPP